MRLLIVEGSVTTLTRVGDPVVDRDLVLSAIEAGCKVEVVQGDCAVPRAVKIHPFHGVILL